MTKIKNSSFFCCFQSHAATISRPSSPPHESQNVEEVSIPVSQTVSSKPAVVTNISPQVPDNDEDDVVTAYPHEPTPDEELALEGVLEKLVADICNKLKAMRHGNSFCMKKSPLKHPDVPNSSQTSGETRKVLASHTQDREVSSFSMDSWKITSSCGNDFKEILSNGLRCVDALVKYIPTNVEKKMIHAVIPILEGIGSCHWITSALFLVGKTLERWEQVNENREDCLRLLEEMAGLTLLLKQIKDRKMDNENMEALIRKAVEKIFNGYLLCCYQMTSSQLHRVFAASYDKSCLSQLKLEIDSTYREITSQMTICIYDAITCINKAPPRPRNVMYPKYAVGIDDQVQKVITMLDYESNERALAVVLHNFGGMGKTTLAQAVFSSLDIKDCKYSMVKLFKDSKTSPSIIELQKVIIGDLTGKKADDIKTYHEGQAEIEKILREVNAFIYIDNVLESEKSNELRKLLPQNFGKAKKTRLLITTRDMTVVCTNLYGSSCEHKIFQVEKLANEHVLNLIGKACGNKLTEAELNGLAYMCRGVPLLVDLVARFIGTYPNGNVKEAYRAVKMRYQRNRTPSGKMTLSEEFATDTLEEECKECFLDICCFFVGKSWHQMKTLYGEDVLNTLQGKALISLERFDSGYHCDEIFDEGRVSVHDVLIDIAWKESEHSRITSKEKITKLFDDIDKGMESVCIKGIQYLDNDVAVPAKCLDVLHDSLRVLDFPHGTLDGKCIYSFPQLRVLKVQHTGSFDLRKLPNIKVLKVENMYAERWEQSFCSRAELEYLELCGCLNLKQLSENLDELQSLRSLTISMCKSLQSIPDSIGCLGSLEVLILSYCRSLKTLPESCVDLSSLRLLSLNGCFSLESIPDSFLESLPSLLYLELSGNRLKLLPSNINCPLLLTLDLSCCGKLEKLPQAIANLSSLCNLQLSWCTNLQKLPAAIGRLASLRELNLSYCEQLNELPEGFGCLSSLFKLDMSFCTGLRQLCSDFGNLASLVSLDLKGCEGLKSLPEGFGGMRLLKELDMEDCKSLTQLCSDFGLLHSLQYLDLKLCIQLKALPVGFGNLRSLKELQMSGFIGILELSNDFGQLQKLEVLHLEGCDGLKALPEGFGGLVSLMKLYMSSCKNIEELCNDFGNLLSLESVHLHRCNRLKALPPGFGGLRSLKRLHMKDCKILEELCHDFDHLSSLESLNIKGCDMVRGEWLDAIMKLPSINKVEIMGSQLLMERWLLYHSGISKASNIIRDNRFHAIYSSLFSGKLDYALVGKNGQLHFVDPAVFEDGIPVLIITESPSDSRKIESLRCIISEIDRGIPIVHFGDRCSDWPKEVENAIVARATSDSVAYLLWSKCPELQLEFPDDDSQMRIVHAIVTPCKLFPKRFEKWSVLSQENQVRMYKKYLKMEDMFKRKQGEWALPLFMEIMKNKNGTPVKLQRSDSGKEVSVKDLEGKEVFIVVFPSSFLSTFNDQKKEEVCSKYHHFTQNGDKEVICTKSGEASKSFNNWITKSIPSAILLESIQLLCREAAQFVYDNGKMHDNEVLVFIIDAPNGATDKEN